jgi:outer membrane protein assembly factor BamB
MSDSQPSESQTPTIVIGPFHVVAAVAIVFSLIVTIVLVGDFARRPSEIDPAENIELLEKRAELLANPANEELKADIRQLDLDLRNDYFRHRNFTRWGGLLLFAGLLVFFFFAGWAVETTPKTPKPDATDCCRFDRVDAMTRQARYASGIIAALVAGVALGAWAFTFSETTVVLEEIAAREAIEEANPVDSADPVDPVGPGTSVDPVNSNNGGTNLSPDNVSCPTVDELKSIWPRFRGRYGAGISDHENVPTTWNGETDVNVAWKTPVPLPGKSSPVIWGTRLFLTGADETTRQVYCFSTIDGSLLWTTDAPGTPASTLEPAETTEDTGFAAPSVSTDGRHAYAMFANGDVVAVDLDGNVAWSKSLGLPENMYGHSQSPVLSESKLIIQYDQGDQGGGLSKLIALDALTGDVLWETPRESGSSWSSPIAAPINGVTQIITTADPYAIGYDPYNGTELWRADVLYGDVGPSPVALGNYVLTATSYLQATLIDATGTGDLTDTDNILWSTDWNIPETISPILTEKFVYSMDDGAGYLSAFDIETGEMVWELGTDVGGTYCSPSLVGGDKLYLFGPDGEANIVQLNEDPLVEPEVVATNPLGEDCSTSPAFQDGCLYIRGVGHLFKIATP